MSDILLLGGCGYIGSALSLHLDGTPHSVTNIDLELRGNPDNRPNMKMDYRDLVAGYIGEFDCVVLLAAHSSVAQSISDPEGAIANNILGFWQLLQKIQGHQKLIYMSSGSVYDGFTDTAPTESSPVSNPRNMYDLSKMADDFMASFSDRQYYGLRLGTICGVSPNLRSELIINKMTKDAVQSGIITLANPDVHRPCLGVGDLCQIITTIIDNADDHRGIYNACSFSGTVQDYATQIAQRTGARIVRQPDSPAYDFSMSASHILDTFAIELGDTIESIVNELIVHFERES